MVSLRWFRIPTIVLLGIVIFGCSIDDSSLKVGMSAPSLRTKTLHDVNGDFSRITTYRYPDERMYQVSLDQALNSDKPIILEFATPGHCTVCDKQLQMLKALLTKYQNPEAFKAFGVIGDPWTYVIDGADVVRFKQPGRMLYNELDMIIAGLLRSESNLSEAKPEKEKNSQNKAG